MSFLSVPSISIISSNSIHSRYIFFLSVYKPLFYPLFYLNCYDWAQTEALATMSEHFRRVCELAHSIACGWNGTLGLGSDDNLRRFTARTRPGLPGPHPDQMPAHWVRMLTRTRLCMARKPRVYLSVANPYSRCHR